MLLEEEEEEEECGNKAEKGTNEGTDCIVRAGSDGCAAQGGCNMTGQRRPRSPALLDCRASTT